MILCQYQGLIIQFVNAYSLNFPLFIEKNYSFLDKLSIAALKLYVESIRWLKIDG